MAVQGCTKRAGKMPIYIEKVMEYIRRTVSGYADADGKNAGSDLQWNRTDRICMEKCWKQIRKY